MNRTIDEIVNLLLKEFSYCTVDCYTCRYDNLSRCKCEEYDNDICYGCSQRHSHWGISKATATKIANDIIEIKEPYKVQNLLYNRFTSCCCDECIFKDEKVIENMAEWEADSYGCDHCYNKGHWEILEELAKSITRELWDEY